MNNVTAAVCSTGFVCHGMNDTQQSVGECHTSQALCVVHACTSFHISIIACYQIAADHLDCVQSKRIGVIAVQSRNISFDCMGHSVHTGVSSQFLWHGFSQSRVNDCNVWSDIEVSQRIFNAFLVVGDNRESGYFSSGTRSGWDSAESSFFAKFWEVKWDAELFKGGVWIFIECPHCFCSIDWRTTADGYDPVRLEFTHHCSTFHNGVNRWVWFNAFKQSNFHACFFQIITYFVQEAKTFHAAAADNNNGTFSL